MANMIKDKVAEDLKRGKIPRGAMRFVDNLCDASIFQQTVMKTTNST